jgi:mono/diheme cytochrome c family protein
MVKEMRRTMVMVAMTLGLLPAVAGAQSADVGGGLAERWCMGCHVVETGPGDVAHDGVPTFPAIAAKQSTTAESLDRYLSTAHTNMPDFSLSRAERGALVAYLLTLR